MGVRECRHFDSRLTEQEIPNAVPHIERLQHIRVYTEKLRFQLSCGHSFEHAADDLPPHMFIGKLLECPKCPVQEDQAAGALQATGWLEPDQRKAS